MNNYLKILQFLLDNGAVMDSDLVRETKSPAVIKVLFEYGLDIHQMITSYEIPLMYAPSPFYVFIHLLTTPFF